MNTGIPLAHIRHRLADCAAGERPARNRAIGDGCGLVGLLLLAVLAGCDGSLPQRALELPPQSLEQRRLQTRRFDGISETALLAACAGVLQDLGFNLDESESDLGLLVASKERTASIAGQRTFAVLLDLLMDVEIDVDAEQRIRASLVSTPAAGASDSHLVRVTFQRIVWTTENEISRREVLGDPELYQRFFERLSKSVFLEANSI